MRYKDEEKRNAIINATVKLVNEIGFVSASVSKIAKEASVAPATIYIYFKNKEDLLVSSYIKIKQELSMAIMQGFDPELPLQKIFKKIWFNSFEYINQFPDFIWFTEQFANSPYSKLINKAEVEKYFLPIAEIIYKGIERKIIKDVPFDVLIVFMFYPVLLLSNPKVCSSFDINRQNIDSAFSLAWDAIKLEPKLNNSFGK